MVLSRFKFSGYILVSIFFGILTTLFTYSFGEHDQIEQLPIIYSFIDSNYLINDFFVNSNYGYSPRYFYANLIAFLATFINIPILFFIGTLFSNVGISIITFLTANKLFRNKSSGIISSALMMIVPTIKIGSSYYLYQTQFNPTTLVFPMVLLAFYFLIQRKLIHSLCITGIISLFHILIGFEYGAIFLGIALLIDLYDKKSLKSILKKGLLGVLIISAFLLPNLIPYYSSNSEIDSALFVEIVANFRHPHHYILSQILTTKETIRLLIFSCLFIVLLYSWKKKTTDQFYRKPIQLLAIILIVLCFISWIFTEIIPNKLITSLQFFRLLDILKWIILLLIANKIASWIQYKIDLTRFKIVLFTALLLFVSSRYVVNQLRSQTERNYFSLYSLEKSKNDISDFIKKNTDKNSVFLAPHDFGFLRVHSKRALVVDFKAFPFQNAAMQEWYKRIEKCYGLNKNEFQEIYRQMTDEKIVTLQKEYGFNYAILDIDTQTKKTIIYQNEDFKIIETSSYAQ